MIENIHEIDRSWSKEDESSVKECFKNGQKSEEEIKKLILPENFDDFQKTIYILTKGQNIQKFAIYQNLQKNFRDSQALKALKDVISLILEKINDEDKVVQIECVRGLTSLLENQTLDKPLLISIFRKTISLLHIPNFVLQNELAALFKAILKTINYELIEKECEQNILLLSEKMQQKSNKIAAVRIIKHISDKTKHNFSSVLNERVRLLCQDQEKELRRVIAREVLPTLCKNSKPDVLEFSLMDKIYELIYDSDLQVKVATIELIISNLDIFPEEVKKTRLINVCLELLNSLNEEVAKKISCFFGKMIKDLDQYLKETQLLNTNFFSSYKEYCQSKNPEIRLNFAFNLPAVLKIFGVKCFEQIKVNYMGMLQNDTREIKICCFCSLVEILKMVGLEEAYKTFPEPICDFISSPESIEDSELMKKILSVIPDLLEVMNPRRTNEDFHEPHRQFFEDVLDCLLALNKKFEVSPRWRLQYSLFKVFSERRILECFSMTDLNEKYSPMMLEAMKNGNNEIKKLACQNLVTFLQINYQSKKKSEVVKNLFDNFMKGKNFQKRMVYLEFCSQSLQTFAFNFLKLYIIPDCFELSNDRVANIRIRLCKMLPEIRNYIMVGDSETLNKFNIVLNKLLEDKDPDVYEKAKWARTEINKKNYNHVEIIKTMENLNKERKMEEEKLEAMEKKEKEEIKKKKPEENEYMTKSDHKPKTKFITNLYGKGTQPKPAKKKKN